MAQPIALDENSILIVVDMQHDFIDGALGTAEAEAIVPGVIERVRTFPGRVVYTLDTHGPNYLETQEGARLPVPHCIKGTPGWEVPEALARALSDRGAIAFEKPAFGSRALAEALVHRNEEHPLSAIELIGLCTDICVVSNALLLKAFLPDVPIGVDARLCAGVTPEAHTAALATMESCQVQIER